MQILCWHDELHGQVTTQSLLKYWIERCLYIWPYFMNLVALRQKQTASKNRCANGLQKCKSFCYNLSQKNSALISHASWNPPEALQLQWGNYWLRSICWNEGRYFQTINIYVKICNPPLQKTTTWSNFHTTCLAFWHGLTKPPWLKRMGILAVISLLKKGTHFILPPPCQSKKRVS